MSLEEDVLRKKQPTKNQLALLRKEEEERIPKTSSELESKSWIRLAKQICSVKSKSCSDESKPQLKIEPESGIVPSKASGQASAQVRATGWETARKLSGREGGGS